MTKRTLLVCIAVVCWGVALAGILELHRLPGNWGHGICGPWGCGPPLQALIACHGFWLVAASLPTVAAVCYWPNRWRRYIGMALVLVGLIGTAAIVGDELFHWAQAATQEQPAYFVQRCVFRIANLIDVPLLPMILVGSILWFAEARRQDTVVDPEP